VIFGNISTHYIYIDGVLRYNLNNTNNDTITTNYIGENIGLLEQENMHGVILMTGEYIIGLYQQQK
jgi:hypothetical protein